jgi:hypothetical protein
MIGYGGHISYSDCPTYVTWLPGACDVGRRGHGDGRFQESITMIKPNSTIQPISGKPAAGIKSAIATGQPRGLNVSVDLKRRSRQASP